MDVKKLFLSVYFIVLLNLLAQSDNRFLVNGVFEVNNSDLTLSENFKMVSIPGDTTISLKSILTGEVGNSWMAFREVGGDYPLPYIPEDEENFKFSPGKAFWIISKNNIHLGPFFVNKVPLQSNTYSIKLNKGWNLISNPFDKPLNWKDVRLLNNLQNDLIYYFYEGYYDNASVKMQPYLGYYYYNRKELDEIILPYPGSVQLHKAEIKTNYFRLKSINDKDTSSITIYLSDKENTELSNQLYPINNFVQFGTTVNLLNKLYSEIVIYPGNEITRLPLSIINRKNKKIKYIFESNITESYSNIVFSILNDKIITPLDNIPFYLNENSNLEILIGKQDIFNNLIIPKVFNVSQNHPNPFNPTTQINIFLPEDSQLTIDVFNSIGEKVSTLFAGSAKAGEHKFTFNGDFLSSGIYFYSVKSNFGVVTKKMVLIK